MDASATRTLRDIYTRELRTHSYGADPAQRIAVEKLDSLRERLIAGRDSKRSLTTRTLRRLLQRSIAPERGVYLWGPVGRGKTWLMDLFFQSLPFPDRRRRHFHRFMHDVHTELKTLSDQDSPLEHVAEHIAAETRVLCFDELYVTDVADAMILGGLFDGLFRRGVSLVATSNTPPSELYRGGLQRQRFLPAIALLERHTQVMPINGGNDYRLRHLTQAGTYLKTDEHDTAQRLHTLFAELSQHSDWEDGALELNDRRIPVVRQSDSAVWFDFQTLCAGPRSQDDYIELARLYSTVVVSDIPQLDEGDHDATRRFIALIDELYDRNVNLVVSAAAAPHELYCGTRLQFEFQRAASRLVEMQSTAYLARERLP